MVKGNKDAKGKSNNHLDSDVTTAISTTSLDKTVASDISLDLTCYSEDNLGTATEESLRTARYAKSTENLGTAKDNGVRTARPSRSEENLGTAKDSGPQTARPAKSTENLGTAKDNIRTAAEPDGDEKTCNSLQSLGTCRSEDSLGTAIEEAIRTARSARSSENLGTAKDNDIRTARFARSSENLGTAKDDNIRTVTENDLRTCTSVISMGTCRSEENLGTSIDDALRTARLAKSLENLVTAIGSRSNVRTALDGSVSDVSVYTAPVIRSCSLENLHTALENIDPEQLEALANDSLTGSPSIYCMDVSSGSDSNNTHLGGVPSQYQLPELRNYSALNNPESAYQYKIQEVLPANRHIAVSAAKSEYILPGMNDGGTD